MSFALTSIFWFALILITQESATKKYIENQSFIHLILSGVYDFDTVDVRF